MIETKTLTIGKETLKIVDGDAVRSYYSTTREVLEGANSTTVNVDYVHGLYEALMAEYPDKVQKNEIHNDDGTFTNYEYVISTGEYNTAGQREVLDAHIKKPKYLILSGIHGSEKSVIISVYRFIRDVLSGHNVPPAFREGTVIHIMPIGTPSGVNAMSRTNDNGVNINRNFDWEFAEVDKGTGNYSGASAASEKETQAIVNWLKANRDAKLFIDCHNSGKINEVAMITGLNNSVIDRAKKIAMRGLDRVIPHWRYVIGYTAHIAKDADGNLKMLDPIFSYSSFIDAVGGAIYYATGVLNIPSLALEATALANADYDTNDYLFKPETVAVGAESLGNILLEFYAQHFSNCECSEVDSFTEDDKNDIVNAVLVALMSTPSNSFSYYSTMVSAVNDVKAGTIGANANADVATAVAGVYTNGGRPYVVLLKDTTEASRVQATVPMTINLNGHMLTVTADNVGIDVKANDVVIDGRANGSGVYVENTKATRTIQVASTFSATIIGGQYTSISQTGTATAIHVGQNGSSAVISDCKINATGVQSNAYGIAIAGTAFVTNCDIAITSPSNYEFAGIGVLGASNVVAYVDNCDISGTGASFVALYMGVENGELNNTLYVSNTEIPSGAQIRINSDTHKLYIGRGNNFTAADTNLPSAVITTNEVYAQAR